MERLSQIFRVGLALWFFLAFTIHDEAFAGVGVRITHLNGQYRVTGIGSKEIIASHFNVIRHSENEVLLRVLQGTRWEEVRIPQVMLGDKVIVPDRTKGVNFGSMTSDGKLSSFKNYGELSFGQPKATPNLPKPSLPLFPIIRPIAQSQNGFHFSVATGGGKQYLPREIKIVRKSSNALGIQMSVEELSGWKWQEIEVRSLNLDGKLVLPDPAKGVVIEAQSGNRKYDEIILGQHSIDPPSPTSKVVIVQ